MLQKNVSLAPLTTLKVGGEATIFVECVSKETLQAVFADYEGAYWVLGGGSNVLIPDEGLAGLVIHNRILGWAEIEEGTDVLLTVGAGEVLDQVVEKSVIKGYWGLENLSHIPGSVGATPVQNVGAYGVEVSDVIESVEVFDVTDVTFKTLTASDCRFGYRDSVFKKSEGKNLIVTNVTYRLSRLPKPSLMYRDLQDSFKDSTPAIEDIREAIIQIRSKKFPDWNEVGTAGSFFKNPIIDTTHFKELKKRYPDLPGFIVSTEKTKVPLGWILDKVCNLKGYELGNLSTYQGQALVLIANQGATAAEIRAFASNIAEKVFAATEISIEWEVTNLQE